jgi:hypothetical protein
VNGEVTEAERFLALVAEVQAKDPELTSLQAGLFVAAELGIADDSRTFARLLGIAHALVLRELNVLAENGKLQIVRQDARTMRTYYAVSADHFS